MRAILKPGLAATVIALTLAVGGPAHAAPVSTGTATTTATATVPASIPDTPPGRQLQWLLIAVKSLPIPVPAIEAHFSPSFRAQLPPDQINAFLAGAADVRLLSVAAATPTSIYAELSTASPGPHLFLTLTVHEDLIEDWGAGALLPSRASLGLPPLSLPVPTGRYPVGTETLVTSDATRMGRRIPVQLWYPTAKNTDRKSTPAPYAPSATTALLAAHLLVPVEDVAAIRTHATLTPKPAASHGFPVVLFSPGHGVTRSFYSGLAAETASHGYIVAVFDHPGDGEQVELPDGTVIPAEPMPDDQAITARVADARAVLNLLERLNTQRESTLRHTFDLSQVAIAGHSLGGATAAEAMRTDPRLRAGVNLDGTLHGDVLRTGLDRPFLLVSSENGADDETWAAFRSHTPAAMTIEVDGTAHMNFSDWPTLLGLRPPDEPRDAAGIGTIDPARDFTIQSAYLIAFLNQHLRGEAEPILTGPSPLYPEVHFR